MIKPLLQPKPSFLKSRHLSDKRAAMTTATPGDKQDRILGMLFGHALGDALGAPHEFKRVKLDKFSGLLEHPILTYRRFQGCTKYPPGSTTDDDEMMLALAWSIITARGYDRDRAIREYITWANSGCVFMGTNTRYLFRGVLTLRGYEERRNKKLAEPPATHSESNGFLMRAAPLAILPNWREAAELDCTTSNFPAVCVDAARVYVGALHDALGGEGRDAIFENACERAETREITDVLMQVADGEARDIETPHSGWCLHAFYTAFWAIQNYQGSYQDTVNSVVELGGDSDTNGAISGALIGAYVGYYQMSREGSTAENLPVLMAVGNAGYKPPPGCTALDRPRAYRAFRIPEVAKALYYLSATLEKSVRDALNVPPAESIARNKGGGASSQGE